MREMNWQTFIDNRFRPLLEKLFDDSLRDASLLRFNKQHPQQLYAVCVYGTILEVAYGCMALVEKQQLTTLPTLLRNMLEAYADFRACLEDPNYFKSMYASFLKEKLRLVRKTQEGSGNPYLKDIVQSVDLKNEESKLESEIEQLTKKGYGPIGTWDRFSKGGLENEYQSMYWLLCLHAHNNLSALEDRHIEKNGDDYTVILFKEDDPDDTIRYFDTLAAIVIDSSKRIHEFLGTKTTNRFDEHLKKLTDLRSHYAKSNIA